MNDQRWIEDGGPAKAVSQARLRLLPLARAFWKETLGTTEGPSDKCVHFATYPFTDKGYALYGDYYELGMGEEAFKQACEAGNASALDRLTDILLASIWLVRQDYEFRHRSYQAILRRAGKAGRLAGELRRKHLAYELRELRVKEYHSMFDPHEENRERARDRALAARQYIEAAFGITPPEGTVEHAVRVPLPEKLMKQVAKRHQLPEAFLRLWQEQPDDFVNALLHHPDAILPAEHQCTLPQDIPPLTPCLGMELTGKGFQHAWDFCTWAGATHLPWYTPLLLAQDASFYLACDESGNTYFHRNIGF